MGVVFGFLAAYMVFFQVAPILSSIAITFFKFNSLKSKFKFFVFMSFMGLGLTTVLSSFYGLFATYYLVSNFESIEPDSFSIALISGPINAILAFIFQVTLVKHWRKYEGQNV